MKVVDRKWRLDLDMLRAMVTSRTRAMVLSNPNMPAGHVLSEAEWMAIGYGRSGVLAAYAALFEPKIKHVVIINPPKSHKEGPTFLNVLRVLDIPEALGLLAPDVRLTLINARDQAFDRVEQIYRLAGAADKLTRK